MKWEKIYKRYYRADLFKIEGVKGYSADYQTCIEEAKDRQEKNERP